MNHFETKVHGKWILAGEHAVMRQSPAIVFPLKSRQLTLNYQESNELQTHFSGEQSNDVEMICRTLLARAFDLLNIDQTKMTGIFHLQIGRASCRERV